MLRPTIAPRVFRRTIPSSRGAGPAVVSGASIVCGLAFLVAVRAPATHSAPPSRERARDTAGAVTQMEMSNVNFHVAPHVTLHIHRMVGTMTTTHPGQPIFFDDRLGYVFHIASGVVGLAPADLAALLNEHVFAYPGAPLKHLQVRYDGPYLVQRGTLHKVVDIPFEITAEVSALPDGHVRIHPIKTRIFDVDGEGLMRALHLTLEKLIDLRGATGVSVKDNDLLLDPVAIVPPPAIDGHVTAIRVDSGELIQTFGEGPPPPPLAKPDAAAPNYLFFKGGTLRFGKLVQLDAEMEIVDADTTTPFDFDLADYKTQLVAGYSQTLADDGLLVHMPDYDAARHGKELIASQPTSPPP